MMTVTLDSWDGVLISLVMVLVGILVFRLPFVGNPNPTWQPWPGCVLFFGGLISSAGFICVRDHEKARDAILHKQEVVVAEQQQIADAAPRLEAQGASDFALGLEYSQCPFDGAEAKHWQAGWRQAKREHTKKRGGL